MHAGCARAIEAAQYSFIWVILRSVLCYKGWLIKVVGWGKCKTHSPFQSNGLSKTRGFPQVVLEGLPIYLFFNTPVSTARDFWLSLWLHLNKWWIEQLCVCCCFWRPAKGVRCPGAELTGNCELSVLGDEDWSPSSGSSLNSWAISQVPIKTFLGIGNTWERGEYGSGGGVQGSRKR